jgi:uncharacterized protein (TIGR02596 family)
MPSRRCFTISPDRRGVAHGISFFWGKGLQAFTLIELLVVISIVAMLLALSAPYLFATIQATKLTSAGDELLFKLSHAGQLSKTQSRPVEIRFYSWTENGVEACRAYQIYYHGETNAASTPAEAAVMFEKNGVLIPLDHLSPLLSQGASSSEVFDADNAQLDGRNAKYRRIVLYPDGTTSIESVLKRSSLTLVQDNYIESSDASNLGNFYTIQIDPVASTLTSYRP